MPCALMYHDVVPAGQEDSSGFPGRDAALYKVTPATFEEHLRAIAAVPDLALTFDDGGTGAMVAADALDRHGLRGYFLITVNYIGAPGFVSEQQIRSLHRRGHFIGSHSCSHPLRMGHCSPATLLDEWTRSRQRLSDITGANISIASVPGGDFAPKVAEAAALAGFKHLFTSEPHRAMRDTFGLMLQGRFTIQRWTTTKTVAGLAEGEWLPSLRQALIWNIKKATKAVGGAHYLRLRKLLIGHRDEVRWGDAKDRPTST